MFYRTVSKSKTVNGTRFTEVFWWAGYWDVTIGGVMFKRLTKDEYMFLYSNF